MAAAVAWEIEQPVEGMEIPTGVKIVKWTIAADGDWGAPYIAPHYSDKNIQVTGTFGGTVTIQGSNEVGVAPPTDALFQTLHDPGMVALTFAAAAIKQVLESPYWIRPLLAGGAGPVVVRMLVGTTARG